VAQADDVRVDGLRGVRHLLHLGDRFVQGERGGRADRALRGQAHVRNENVRARAGHVAGLFGVEHVGRGEQVALVGHPDHVDLQSVAHPGLLQVGPEHTVDQPDGGEVLNAAEAHPAQLVEERAHEPEGVGAVDAGEDGGVLDHGQHLVGHVQDDGVGVAVRQHAGQRSPAGHPESAGVVDDQQVDAAGLGGLGRDAGARAAADDRSARGNLGAESVEDCLAFHRSLLD
jgi:hypothetical protein